MTEWEKFENQIAKYIQDMLSNYDVLVKKLGSADSTLPDIEITINSNGNKIYLEVKMPTAQTSQFVVTIQDNKFVYGKNNEFPSNKYSDEIIDILNKNFELYGEVKQKGLNVPVPDLIANNWIVSNMENKNVKFVASADYEGNKKVFPINEFNNFFDIKTILRRKKSGSREVPKKDYNDFKEHIALKFSDYEYTFEVQDKKLYINLPLDLKRSDCYIESELFSDGKSYFLSNKGNGKYEARLTSSINNINIIFEINLKYNNNLDKFTIQCLIDYINNM